jgi:Zn-dependent protease with chaperone function
VLYAYERRFFMESLVNPKERVYFRIALVISLLVYVLLVVSIVGIVYIVIGAIIGLMVHGLFIGSIRGNGIRVSEKQFPEVYRIASQFANQMGLNPMPAIYVLQAGGLLNAFATKFLGRSFVVIYSDVLELAYAKGEPELAFVICHELAHIKRKHLTWRWLLYPSMLVPFLGTAYSRACEYTCDRFAAHYKTDGAVGGLLVLASGKKLYRNVNPQEFSNQAYTERGFWVWFSEVLSTHPNLPKRVNALGLERMSKSVDYLATKVESV